MKCYDNRRENPEATQKVSVSNKQLSLSISSQPGELLLPSTLQVESVLIYACCQCL